jgi:uncharacterized tellurite resistance protein B-like protein
MLDRLRQFIAELGPRDVPRDEATDAQDVRVAAAALLVHAASADGTVSAAERQTLEAGLRREFGLAPAEASRLFQTAKARDEEAVDLYAFTSVLKRRLDEPARQRLIRMMWELVLVDGAVHEFEDNTIWRVAELLGVASRERMLAKRRAARRAGRPDDPAGDAAP